MIRRRIRDTVTATLVVVVVMSAVPAVAEDPSEGQWPIESQSSLAGLPAGLAWVRSNPMLITGLSASMGSPPQSVVSDMFGPFGATATMLWQDGPAEVPGWQQGGANPDGHQLDGPGQQGTVAQGSG